MRYKPFPVVVISLASFLPAIAAPAIELGLPAQCELGKTCFMQQYPDMDAGSAAADPLCGTQSYDGHKGTDLRILSMSDIEKGYAVIAVADGKVLRIRDGEADHLAETQEDIARIAGKECGNGLVMQLAEGYEVQYCHLRKDSIGVKPGDHMRKGDRLGEIGASGFAQFPHVHITVSQFGTPIDPLTGRKLSEGCTNDFQQVHSLFARDVVEKLHPTKPEILAQGVAGKVIDHQSLVREGAPPLVSSSDGLFIAWSWFANLRKDDTIRLLLKNEQGRVVVDHMSDPLERDKATFSAFAGRKRSLPPGWYELTVSVMQGASTLRSGTSILTVQ